ncbi:hypothetical protein PAMA_004851 [Pampus argenteus]
MTWYKAKQHCEGNGAKLASLKNEWNHAYVELMALNLQAPLWIGLNKVETDGYFRYIDGWPISFTHWGNTEPSSDRPCVYIDVDGKWKTAHCNQTMNSVCMTSTDVPPTESSEFPGVCPENLDTLDRGQNYFWLPFKGHCYIFFTELKDWPNAAASCVQHGGLLASIEDPSEQIFIHDQLKIFQDSYTSFWIGLYKAHKGWFWLDKTIMDYTNWDAGQPGNGNQVAVTISSSEGTWKESYLRYARPYICKTPKVLLLKPTPSATARTGLSHHSNIVLAVVLVIVGIAGGTVIAVFLYKKLGCQSPIPDRLTAFDNPLFNKVCSQPDLVDTDKLVENAEEENPEPIITSKNAESNE